ncbi:MAG: OmpA family protein, partial [Chitinophagaceae bacterium]
SKDNGSFLSVMPIGGNYAFNVVADGYLFYSEHYELETSSITKPIIIEIDLQKLKVGNNVILKNIFFNTNEYTLLPSSLVELGTLTDLLENNTGMSIEIQGHTDNVGSESQNEKLSLNRARSVYDFLVSKGISAERMTYKGYGENKPIKSNDTEDNRKENRRTSFIITKI